MNPEELTELSALLKVLQEHNVRSFRLGDMSFELGAPLPKYAPPLPGDADAELMRQRREFEELLYASAGG